MTDIKTPDMRTLMETLRRPYPTREGSSVSAWKAHIIDVMHWKIERYDDADLKWNEDVRSFGNNGIKALTQLAISEELILSYHKRSEKNLPVYGAYGKHTGWGGMAAWQEVVIQRGPKFPA